MSQLTTHILDTMQGKPATGVSIILYRYNDGAWKEIANGITDTDGRIKDLLQKDLVLATGEYKLRFETQAYFDRLAVQSFYPWIEIIFRVTDSTHYHVPLLLNAFGYSTYRGS